ncbi:response regulator [Candidatus Micrarchaeota archaeon]|nr:response regulator [Candidatus Micrarchaeota archaeon]
MQRSSQVTRQIPQSEYSRTALRGKQLLEESIRCPKRENRALRVLVLDDCPEVLFLYQDLLRSDNVQIFAPKPVNSVKEAMDLVREVKPDLVISDLCLTMGRTEGFEILARIRKEMPFVPVALSTSSYPYQHDLVAEIDKKEFDAVFNKGDLKGLQDFISRNL